MHITSRLLAVAAAALFLSASSRAANRVACVGNSITEGIGASSSSKDYPSLLQTGLGTQYEVKNFGISGSTVTTLSEWSYMLHRDRWPAAWTLAGSNDGKTWKTLDTRSNQFFGGTSSLMEYTIAKPTSYKSYRLTFRNLTTNQHIELSELQYYGQTTEDYLNAIEPVVASPSSPSGQWYKLDGTPTQRPTGHGVFVRGGKKIMI